MASTFSCADILADAANLSNCPAFSLTTRITLPQATYWLAQSARSLSALIRQKHSEDRELLRVDTVPTPAGFRYVSLPSDCGEVHAVIWTRGANDAVLLGTSGDDDLVSTTEGQGWDASGMIPTWRLEGQTIALYPTSAISEQLTIYYTTHVSTGFATFQGQLDFDKWVTLDVCERIATAKNKPDVAAGFQQRRALLENDLLARSRKRDVNRVSTIRDTRKFRAWRNTL